ncbi:MAG: MFS transporter [Coriobacteriales bacterium]
MTATAPVFNAKKAWLVTIISILSSIGYGLGMYSGMTTLMLKLVYFNIDFTTNGVITGVIGLTALISGIPAGIIVGKIGPRKLCLLCLGLGLIGGTGGLAMLLIFGRATNFLIFSLWGIFGMLAWGAVSIAGTIMTTSWFPPQKRPLPMGCAGLFVPLALLIILLVSSPLISLGSTEGYTQEELAMTFGQSPDGFVIITIFCWVYSLVFFILSFIFVREPKPENSFLGVNAAGAEAGEQAHDYNEGRNIDGFKNFGIWLIVIVYMCYTWGSSTYATYWPTYIESDPSLGGFSVAPATANMMSTAVSYSMIAVSLIVGFILTKIKMSKWTPIVLAVTIMIAFNSFFMFNQPGTWFFVIYLVIYGCSQELYPCMALTLMPEMTNSSKELGVGMGLVSFCTNLIGTVASSVNGYLRDTAGNYHALNIPLDIICVLVLIFGITLTIYWSKRWRYLKAKADEAAAAREAAAAGGAAEPAAEGAAGGAE